MKTDILLNSKNEFRQAPIIRVVPTTGLQEEQEGTRSHSWARGGGRDLARDRRYVGRIGDRRDARLPG